MAKKFVRKDTDIRWIQEIRDWTNDIGDILVKDDRYAYVRTYGEYKPISFPMVWDYKGIPKNEITKSDYYVDKTGVHKFDKKKNTFSKYDLTDGIIDENRTVSDDNGKPINQINIHQDRQVYSYGGKILDHAYYLTFDENGYDFGSDYTGADNDKRRNYRRTNNYTGLYTTYNNSNSQYVENISRNDYFKTYSYNDDTTNSYGNINIGGSYTNIGLSNIKKGQTVNYSLTMNDSFIMNNYQYNSDSFTISVQNNYEYINFSSKNGVYYQLGLNNGLFYLDASEGVINSLKDYYDKLLGVTAKYNDALSKIANLQNQINDLQTQINNLKQ